MLEASIMLLVIVSLMCGTGLASILPPPVFDHGVDLPTSRPLNLAHRGFSGIYPENTLKAFESGIESGADGLECDISITKDLHLICIHESWMSDLTNVADVYPESRMNTYFVPDQARLITDYFTVDFTLDELRVLGVRQRGSDRDPGFDFQFPIPEFREYLDLIRMAERPVAVYAELKDPRFVNGLDIIQDAGTSIEDILLAELENFGCTARSDPCFIQSFNADSIKYMAERNPLPMSVLLLRARGVPDNSTLEEYASYAYGIGPSRRLIVTADVNNRRTGSTDLVDRAHAYGLRVHAYTFKNENRELLWDYAMDPYLEYQEFLDLGVDGLFTDFPATYDRFLDVVYGDVDDGQ